MRILGCKHPGYLNIQISRVPVKPGVEARRCRGDGVTGCLGDGVPGIQMFIYVKV